MRSRGGGRGSSLHRLKAQIHKVKSLNPDFFLWSALFLCSHQVLFRRRLNCCQSVSFAYKEMGVGPGLNLVGPFFNYGNNDDCDWSNTRIIIPSVMCSRSWFCRVDGQRDHLPQKAKRDSKGKPFWRVRFSFLWYIHTYIHAYTFSSVQLTWLNVGEASQGWRYGFDRSNK